MEPVIFGRIGANMVKQEFFWREKNNVFDVPMVLISEESCYYRKLNICKF